MIHNLAGMNDCMFQISGPSTLGTNEDPYWNKIIGVLREMVFLRRVDASLFCNASQPLTIEAEFQISFADDENKTQIAINKEVADQMHNGMLFLKLEQRHPDEEARIYILQTGGNWEWKQRDENILLATLRELCWVDDKPGVQHFLGHLEETMVA